MRFFNYRAMLYGIALLCTASVISTHGQAASWQLLGLSDRSINCILADDTTTLLAGTNKGLSVYYGGTWYDIDVNGLPVTCIARISTNAIAVGAGNGSKSDALYVGTRIRGAPYYQLRFQHYFISPTAMLLQATMAIPRLYVGGANTVAVCMINNDSLLAPQPYKIPPYAFGIEYPFCAGLQLYNGSLYAGGYDRSTIMGGPGNLLILVGDSLQVARRLDVTALAQGSFSEVGPQELVIGTRDSGVLFYCPSLFIPWTKVSGPTKEQINSLLTMPGMLFSDMLFAAVASGVFIGSGHSGNWTEVGDIPQAPNCLAVLGTATGTVEDQLLAGTVAGVYLYSRRTEIFRLAAPEFAGKKINPVICRNGEVRLSLPVSANNTAEVTLYNASGKLCSHTVSAQSTVAFRLPSNGLYYYRCSYGGKTSLSGVIVNAK